MNFNFKQYWLIIRNWLEPFRLDLFKIKWRKVNQHNKTFPGNRFNINKVFVGNETYGTLNVFDYNDTDSGRLIIGNWCSIARTSKFLLSGNHRLDSIFTYPIEQLIMGSNYCESKGDIVIDDDVWIAEGVIILSGVHIGKGAVVAAGAVVCSDVPPYAIVGGVNAKVIKYRFPKDVVDKLLSIDYGQLNKEHIITHIDNYLSPLENEIDWLNSLPKYKCNDK